MRLIYNLEIDFERYVLRLIAYKVIHLHLYFSLLGGKFCFFCNFCPLKALTILYEVNEIRMDDPVPFLKKTVGGKKIFGIIIPCNLFQRSDK